MRPLGMFFDHSTRLAISGHDLRSQITSSEHISCRPMKAHALRAQDTSCDYMTDQTMHFAGRVLRAQDMSFRSRNMSFDHGTRLAITGDVFRSQPRAAITGHELRSQDMYLDNRRRLTITEVVFRSQDIFCNHRRSLAIAGYAFRS